MISAVCWSRLCYYAGLAPSQGLTFSGDVAVLPIAGNFDGFQPEIGRAASSYGLLLRGDGKGAFTPMPARESGFFVPGQSRDIARVGTAHGDLYVVTRNNDRPLLFRANSQRTVASAKRGTAAAAPSR